ncbi:RDD family protein [Streptomyces sp. 891-h]|uniref:RDD family protein n=1 Tax=Streptomyces sp. 891-h TaxID=2720714 RepID=UPI001FAAB8A6|nr:RDD family protein [Streptomyces sp. 891-h]UNZ15737.1 RDD family protein [Streptomyces sp. 891-h]
MSHPGPSMSYGVTHPPHCQPGLYAPPHPSYASWLRRASAFLLDIALNSAPLFLLMIFENAVWEPIGENGETIANALACTGLLVTSAVVLYQLIREGRTGQTVGKELLGIRALRDHGGQMLGVGLALGRRLLQFLNYPVFGLGWWWALGDAKNQTFADKLTSVVVVRANAAPL